MELGVREWVKGHSDGLGVKGHAGALLFHGVLAKCFAEELPNAATSAAGLQKQR